MTDKSDNRREYFRYNPDTNALVEIQLDGNRAIMGLMRDESYSGCAAVYQKSAFHFEEGETVEVQAGNHNPRPADIKWIEELDDKLIKVGFEWVE